ncbi:MAG: metallophosphoesterase [Proteobacteria bacterium]|nr:MAG: metallophosphoesterase [Pseudomonadota bacterium]
MNWFVVLAVAILSALLAFLGYRITGLGRSSWLVAGLAAGLILLYPLVWYEVLPESLNKIVRTVVHADMGFLGSLIALLLLRDLVFVPIKFYRPEMVDFAFAQRTTIAILIVSILLPAYGYWHALQGPRVVSVEIPLRSLPTDLEGYRIVQISDLHAGPGIGRNYVQNVVDQVLTLKADLVVLTGDIGDGTFEKYKDRTEPLPALAKATRVLYISGNHEYIKDSGAWLQRFRELGATVLLNEHVVIHHKSSSILFAGVVDPDNKIVGGVGPDIEKALSGSPSSNLKVLLAHRPDIAKDASNIFDLQLSGHTHGGQFFPFNLIIKLLQPFPNGLKKLDDMWVYTNPGTGYWGPPIRLGTTSEITILKLTNADLTAEQ